MVDVVVTVHSDGGVVVPNPNVVVEDVPCDVVGDVPCDVVEDVANHDVVVEGDASNLYVVVVVEDVSNLHVEDVPNPHVVVVVGDDPNLVGDGPNLVVGEAPGHHIVMVGYLASPHVVVVVVPHCYATILMGSWEILHFYLIMAVYQC